MAKKKTQTQTEAPEVNKEPETENLFSDEAARPKRKQRCENCEWWDRFLVTQTTEESTPVAPCRGGVPQLGPEGRMGDWPYTEETDWCRNWEFIKE